MLIYFLKCYCQCVGFFFLFLFLVLFLFILFFCVCVCFDKCPVVYSLVSFCNWNTGRKKKQSWCVRWQIGEEDLWLSAASLVLFYWLWDKCSSLVVSFFKTYCHLFYLCISPPFALTLISSLVTLALPSVCNICWHNGLRFQAWVAAVTILQLLLSSTARRGKACRLDTWERGFRVVAQREDEDRG